MKRMTAEQAQSNLDQVIEQANAAHEPVGIDGAKAQGVLVPLSDWNAMQETLYLLSIPGMRESIRAGMAEPFNACSESLDW